MSAPDGRHSLAGMMHESRAHRRDVLAARLDETGADPVWGERLHDALAREMRLDVMWARTGPGRRDRWAAAIARDLTRRGQLNGVPVEVDRVEPHIANSSAAEIVAREMLRLVPPPPGLLKAAMVEVERAVREAEEVLGE